MESLTRARRERRRWLARAALGAMGLLNARAASETSRPTARSLILIWLDGGPSQLETFDPHPGARAAGPTRAIPTRIPGVSFSEHLPRLAELADRLAIVRSMVTKEGDHERGRYLLKTGYRPSPALVHPALGSICAAELPADGTEIPRYLQILTNDRLTRGGYLGDRWDPVAIGDPKQPPENVTPRVSHDRRQRRLHGVGVIEGALARRAGHIAPAILHDEQARQANQLIDSAQLRALDIRQEPAALRDRYGETPFGRGLLAARRLVEHGVRCVEVQLAGWDSHANNFSIHQRLAGELDVGMSALLTDLGQRGLWDETIVLCTGEFGRSPTINGLDGRDHWTNGFSLVLAGGGIRGGQVLGETDPEGTKPPTTPIGIERLYATILTSLGISPQKQHITSGGRPIKLADGAPIDGLLG